MKMLTIKDLSVVADNKEILNNFNLNINDGETHCIMGPNGVGKSTICRAILKDPNYLVTKGTIKYKDTDLKDLTTTAIYYLKPTTYKKTFMTVKELMNTVKIENLAFSDLGSLMYGSYQSADMNFKTQTVKYFNELMAEYGNEYYWEDQIFNNGWNMA